MPIDPDVNPIGAASEYVFQADVEKMRADLMQFRDRLAILAGGLDAMGTTDPGDVETIQKLHVHIGAVRIRFAKAFENHPPEGVDDILLIAEVGSHIAVIERAYAKTIINEKK